MTPPTYSRRRWNAWPSAIIRWACAAMLLGGIAIIAVNTPAAAATVRAEERHPSGITILKVRPANPAPLAENQAMALDEAGRASAANPENLAFPWFDRAAGQLVLTATTAIGRDKATSFTPKHAAAPTVPRRVQSVAHNQAYLQRILDKEIGTGPLVTVRDDYPDPENNRVVLEVESAPDPFLYGLAARYDPTAIAVLVSRDLPVGAIQSRNHDVSPFWGGANISTPIFNCTDAFPWIGSGPTYYMLTAGHCGVGGGSVYTPNSYMGSINSSQVSWANGTGSIPLGGAYRGDIALITVARSCASSGITCSSGPAMYRGGPGSSTWATVREMWSRSPQPGDQYCTGGAYSGEMCGWVTDKVGGNFTYRDGTVARHVSWGYKVGNCMVDGDSGGPVYTVRPDGTIAAKGIHSGGGSITSCFEVYSDIWDAYIAFPGWLNTA